MHLPGSRSSVCRRCEKVLVRVNVPFRFVRGFGTTTPARTKFTHLPTRRLISLRGEDAPKFLQGLVSANIPPRSKGPQDPIYTAFLNAQGRVLHDVFIYPFDQLDAGEEKNAYLLEVDRVEVSALYKHLKRYKLRAKIDIRILDEGESKVWSAWDHDLEGRTASLMDKRVPVDAQHPNMGTRLILHRDERPTLEGEEVSLHEYEVRRTMLGVPEGQTEIIKEVALPQESNIDYMGGIDFRKGCYVGQELTIRTHHTGVVRKRILPVQLYEAWESPPPSLAYSPDSKNLIPPHGSNISRCDKKGRSAGRWLGGIGNIGLALCRLEVMTDTILTGEGSLWSPSNEFQLSWENGTTGEQHNARVKAFLPWWHAQRAEAQRILGPNG